MAARLNLREYQALNTFDNAAAAGFNTSTFDLSQNLEDGETRSGLDEDSLREVRRIMDRWVADMATLAQALHQTNWSCSDYHSHRVGFDEARLIRQQRIMRQNGIDPATGLPLDKKAITRLS
ncbi:hypothetical protein EMMF5_000622 [Cystobasidiomycetes sp. EMM_F5]